MRKLIILVLVFGLASTASAAISLRIATVTDPCSSDYAEVGSEIDLAVSENIWIGIYNDTQAQKFTALPRFLDTANAEWTGGNAVYVPPAVPGAYNYYLGVTGGYDYWYSCLASGVPTDYNGVGVVSGFEFHCLVAENDVVVELISGSTGYVVDSITVHQVPEPATIALLGLGVLALISRKRR